MLTSMNRWMRGTKRKGIFSAIGGSRRGQVALLLVILIAVGLIFFAVTLNLGKIAQIRVYTTMASNTSAAFMGSLMASYAESMYQAQLGGEEECGDDLTVDKWSGLAVAILTIFAAIISVLTCQPGPVMAVVSIIGLSAALGSAAIQLSVIQPGLDQLLNTMFESIESPADQFVERGIYTALRNSVTDSEVVDDIYDMDMDGLFAPHDRVSRFAYYYTAFRVQDFTPPTANPQAVANFLTDLGEFVYEPYYYLKGLSGSNAWRVPHLNVHGDDWALFSPVRCENDIAHVCCAPPPVPPCLGLDCSDPQARDEHPECCRAAYNFCRTNTPLDHSECSRDNDDFEDIGRAYAECNPLCAFSWAGCSSLGHYCGTDCYDGRCRIYDPFFHNDELDPGDTLYFKPFLGRDDGNAKCIDDPVSGIPEDDPIGGDRTVNTSGGRMVTDAKGLFRLLWVFGKMVDLREVNEIHVSAFGRRELCVWCNTDYEACEVPSVRNPDLPDCPLRAVDLQTCCVHEGNRFDAVPNATDLVMDEDACPHQPGIPYEENAHHEVIQVNSLWKPGDDMYCSFDAVSPYDELCPWLHCLPGCDACDPDGGPCAADGACYTEHTDNPAGTTLTDPYNWTRDPLDQMSMEINEFVAWADSILSKDVLVLGRTVASWFPQAFYWIHPERGRLAHWLAYLRGVKEKLEEWRDGTYIDQDGTDCLTVCYESGANCSDNTPPEGVTGTMSDIVACLEEYRDTFDPQNNTYAKIDYRVKFLREYVTDDDSVLNRLINDTDGTLTTAIRKIEDFLTHASGDYGGVQQMIEEWERFMKETDYALPGRAMYGWKDTEEDGGMWHIVYAETKLPTRCDCRCGRQGHNLGGYNDDCPESDFPYVHHYKRYGGSKRYYSLVDSLDRHVACDEDSVGDREYDDDTHCFRGGTVKSRVIRYDQDHDFVEFANRFRIWRFVYSRPGTTPISPERLDSVCAPQSSAVSRPGEEAFLLNRRGDNPRCWDLASQLLRRGVKDETCVEYFFRDVGHLVDLAERRRGIYTAFTPCEGEW